MYSREFILFVSFTLGYEIGLFLLMGVNVRVEGFIGTFGDVLAFEGCLGFSRSCRCLITGMCSY